MGHGISHTDHMTNIDLTHLDSGGASKVWNMGLEYQFLCVPNVIGEARYDGGVKRRFLRILQK